MWLDANEIVDDKKTCTFLALVGPSAYQILKNLCSPALPKTKSYAELKKTLTDHYKPKPIIIAERFRFHKRNQNKSETISDYIVELKKLSSTCEFGAFLEEALRDRLVCGLTHEAIQRRLLAEKDLNFKSASEICLAMEMAMANTKELTNNASSGDSSVNKVSHFGKKKPYWKKKKNLESDGGKSTPSAGKKKCWRCGGHHDEKECKFKNEKCYKCDKRGHISAVCKSKSGGKSGKGAAHCVEDDSEDEHGMFTVYAVETDNAVHVDVELDGHKVNMQVDTGATVSIISEVLYNKVFKNHPLDPTTMSLKTYSGDKLALRGQFEVPVQYEGQRAKLPLVVVSGEKPALLGRNWLKAIKLDWGSIFSVRNEKQIDEILQKHKPVFQNKGTIKHFKAKLHVKENAKPVFHRARPVPYALKAKVEAEIDRLEKQGIISKVNYSEWASPIVTVPKIEEAVRICGDYKVSVNPVLEVDQHPLPSAQDLFATLAGAKIYTKLDLSHAYQQLLLDEESKKYLTVNTSKGLYQYHRLTYGIASAPAIFQNVMDQVLQGLDHVVWFLDDILIATSAMEEHLKILEEVLRRLEKYGICVKLPKCKFFESKVEYLGHCVDAEGLQPASEKVAAILQAPLPTCQAELRSWLGILNYYGKFLGNLATVLYPLHELLKKDCPWQWSQACEEAFHECKKTLMSSKVLVHYDSTKPLVEIV